MQYNWSESGSALVFVLVVSLILLSGSVWSVRIYKEGVDSTAELMDKMQASVNNESAIQLLQFSLATGVFTSAAVHNSLPEMYGLPDRLYLDGSSYTVNIARQGQTIFTLQDLAGCVNIYFESRESIANLLSVVGASESEIVTIVSSLLDWKDRNDFHHANGAESWYYSQLKGGGYQPRNNGFIQSPHELLLVKGMTPEYMDKIEQVVTVSPIEGYNVQTMGALVLASNLGITTTAAEKLLDFRREKGRFTQEDVETILGSGSFDLTTSGLGFPSKALRFSVSSVVGNARVTVHCDMNFVEDDFGPMRVLTWNEGA